MRTIRRIAIPAVAAAIVGMVALGATAWEPDNVSPSSLAYLIAIPAIARAVPVYEECAAARYSLRRQDGLSPRLIRVRYDTALPANDVLDRYGRHLEDHGCAIGQPGDTIDAGRCGPPYDHAELDVAVAAAPSPAACSTVTVTIVGG